MRRREAQEGEDSGRKSRPDRYPPLEKCQLKNERKKERKSEAVVCKHSIGSSNYSTFPSSCMRPGEAGLKLGRDLWPAAQCALISLDGEPVPIGSAFITG
jgi:hypothetical protein